MGGQAMYKIRVIWVGRTQEKYLQEGIAVYLKKLSPYVRLECEEIKPADYAKGHAQQWKMQETQGLLKKIQPGETTVFLDEYGTQHTSLEFAQWLDQQKTMQVSRINFVMGGAYGMALSQPPAQSSFLSLSAMTLNHQMVRLIFLEQLYRAFTILHGEPYHHV